MFELDVAIDLGATTRRVYHPRRRVLREHRASTSLGCAQSPPDLTDVEESVRGLLGEISTGPLRRPRVVLTVPCHTPMAERASIETAARRAGARTAATIEAPLAAGIGAGIDVGDERPTLVVDIGGCWTEVAVVASGAMQVHRSIPVGGNALDAAIQRRMLGTHGLRIPLTTAEDIKLALGSAVSFASEGLVEVTGRDACDRTGRVVVSSQEVRRWVREPVDAMLSAVADVLDNVPRRLAADLLDGEIVLTGGGALLPGLDTRVRNLSGMAVRVAPSSAQAAVLGAGRCAEQLQFVGAEGLEPPTSAV